MQTRYWYYTEKEIKNIYNKKDSYKTYIIISLFISSLMFISLFLNIVEFTYENITIIEFTYIDYIKLFFDMAESVDIDINSKIFLFCYLLSLLSTFSVIIERLLLTFGGNNWKKSRLNLYRNSPSLKYINTIILVVLITLCVIYHFVVFDYSSSEIEVGSGFYSYIIGTMGAITLSILHTKLIDMELVINKYKKTKEQIENMNENTNNNAG